MHKFDFNADLKEVYNRLAERHASLAQQEERGIRIPDNAVRGCGEAPKLVSDDGKRSLYS